MTKQNIADKQKERIINYCLNTFLKDGFSSISMDSISKSLGISKKTLYKFYFSKEALVQAVVEKIMTTVAKDMEPILNSNQNSIRKNLEMMKIVSNLIFRMSDKWLNDLKTYYPELWDKIDKFRIEMFFKNHIQVLSQGQKEGLVYEYPTDIIFTAMISAIRSIINPEFLLNHNYSVKTAALIIFDILMNGLLTEKGKNTYNELMKELKRNIK